ncbi:MAG: PAS domain S-box protein [Opitutaceae bacterium]
MPAIRAQNVAIRGSRLGNLLEEFPYSATVANRDNVLVYVNRAFTQVYGWEEREILNLTPRLLVRRDFPEVQLREIRQAISTAPTGWCGQLENVTKSGKKFLARVWAARIRPNADLPCLYYIGLTVPAESGLRPKEELTSRLAGALLQQQSARPSAPDRISRSQQIDNLRSLGYTTKEIAQLLGVAPNSINVALHRERQRAGGNHGRAAARRA